MLGLVDNTLARIEPVLAIQGGFRADVSPPNALGEGRFFIRSGNEIVETGVTFFKMDESDTLDASIEGRSGRYRLKGKGKARFRAVFAGQHEDVEVSQ